MMEVLGVFVGDVLLRQVSEALQIREECDQANIQQEWRQIQLLHLGLLECIVTMSSLAGMRCAIVHDNQLFGNGL